METIKCEKCGKLNEVLPQGGELCDNCGVYIGLEEISFLEASDIQNPRAIDILYGKK